MAIQLATGKVLWTHNYNSPNGGPDGVNVVGRHRVRGDEPRRGRPVGGHRPAAVEPDADRQRPRGHRHGARVQPRHRVRVDRAGQPDRGRVSRRRQVGPVGAERPDRRARVELGRGAEPVGETSPQLRRRPVGSAVVRQRGQPLHRHGQPRPDRPEPLAPRLSVGDQPAGPRPVHRLGGQAEPAGEAAVVLPAHPARPLRLGPAEFAGPHAPPTGSRWSSTAARPAS